MSDPIFIPAQPIPAQAVVDKLRGGPVPLWEVQVWGGPGYEDYRRTYQIEAKDDNTAAFDGIQRFVEEMQAIESVNVGGD